MSEETTMLAADAANRQVEAKTDDVTVKREDGKVSAKTSNVSSSNKITVQQNQADEGSGSEANTGDVNIAQNSSSSCKNPRLLDSLNDETSDESLTFTTTGDKFRVTYDVNFDTDGDNFRIEIDRNGT